MSKRQFGGAWTKEKLDRLRKYLEAYRKLFSTNPRAQYFRTIYVDAFAGTGDRVDSAEPECLQGLFGQAPDEDMGSYQKGSARSALEVEPPFHEYIFVERQAVRIDDLHALRSEFPDRKVSVRKAEANAFLCDWCRTVTWQYHRAVVFLDPYGMQVECPTLEAIAATHAIDLWLLFPLCVAVTRLLTQERPPKPWAAKLTRFFGSDEWEEAFYSRRSQPTLFDDPEVSPHKEADWRGIGDYFVKRLETIFVQVAQRPLPLLNSRNTPIYLLYFAAGNEKGASTAVKIAQDILNQ